MDSSEESNISQEREIELMKRMIPKTKLKIYNLIKQGKILTITDVQDKIEPRCNYSAI